jgi:hypothetical protein
MSGRPDGLRFDRGGSCPGQPGALRARLATVHARMRLVDENVDDRRPRDLTKTTAHLLGQIVGDNLTERRALALSRSLRPANNASRAAQTIRSFSGCCSCVRSLSHGRSGSFHVHSP